MWSCASCLKDGVTRRGKITGLCQKVWHNQTVFFATTSQWVLPLLQQLLGLSEGAGSSKTHHYLTPSHAATTQSPPYGVELQGSLHSAQGELILRDGMLRTRCTVQSCAETERAWVSEAGQRHQFSASPTLISPTSYGCIHDLRKLHLMPLQYTSCMDKSKDLQQSEKKRERKGWLKGTKQLVWSKINHNPCKILRHDLSLPGINLLLPRENKLHTKSRQEDS